MEAVDDPMARLLEPYEAASMALEVVLGYVANYIDEAALQESVLGRIVETCVEDCLTMVGMAEVSREGPAAPGSWELDAEPQVRRRGMKREGPSRDPPHGGSRGISSPSTN